MTHLKLIPVAIAALSLIGCASPQTPVTKVSWISSYKTDEFTDKTTCIATVGSIYTETNTYTLTGRLYPFIQNLNGEVIVGVKSGGKVQSPVGDIQLRVDKNKAWEISTDETPADKDNLPAYMNGAALSSDIYTQNLDDEQKKVVEDAFKASMDKTTKLMSPYTAATGEKAKSIINEMLNGKTLIYRSKGFGMTKSTTGEYALDESLAKSMKECSITL